MSDDNTTGQATADDTGTDRATMPWNEGVPEKFHRDTETETRAALAAGYTELEKARAKPAGDQPAGGIKLGEQQPAPETLDAVLERAGLDTNTLAETWGKSGTLTDEQYEAIAKVSPAYTRDIVNTIADGMAAKRVATEKIQSEMRGEAVKIAGGEQSFNLLIERAGEFVPADEFDDLQARLDDPKKYKGAMRELVQLAKDAGITGRSPLIESDHKPTATTPDRFTDAAKLREGRAELTRLAREGKMETAEGRRLAAKVANSDRNLLGQ